MAIWYISWPLSNFVVNWHIFPSFGTLYEEKSGSPANGSISPFVTEAFSD
jgi:hypothetical protein